MQCYIYKIGYLRGKVLESEGKYHEALTTYNESLSYYPRHFELRKAIGKVHRILGDYDKSIDIFKQLLLPSPISGELSFEIAKSYYADGNRKKALEHLEIVLNVWKDADATYKPAIEAREKWIQWNQIN
ncbi:MAG: tetratricopeptide repeat protein [Candidatus Marinimicrobia bacterium]|nr:tetratricopeptide repeat protein [Candidatus Neomarinimicrobiota bacterium]